MPHGIKAHRLSRRELTLLQVARKSENRRRNKAARLARRKSR